MRAYVLSALLLSSRTCAAEQEFFIPPEEETSSNPAFSLSSWEGPSHCIYETCVFYSAQRNGGMALVTSPRYAECIQDLPVTENWDIDPSPFVVEGQGKEMGLRANRPIKRGEVLMVREPAFAVMHDAHWELGERARGELYEHALSQFSEEAKEACLTQLGMFKEKGANRLNVVRLQVFEQGEAHYVCYPDLNMFRHDCRPNVYYSFDGMNLVVVAGKDIAPEEELSIHILGSRYENWFLEFWERQERFAYLGFDCGCALCQGTATNETANSDARLRHMKHLIASMRNDATTVTPSTGDESIALHEEEGLTFLLGVAYAQAAANFGKLGDEARMREYAEKAIAHASLETGPESGVVQGLQEFAANPRAYERWGVKAHLLEKQGDEASLEE